MIIQTVSPSVQSEQESKKIRASKELESYFIGMMLKEMRKTVGHSDLLGGNQFQRETYYQMLDEQMARSVAENGGFGLAKQLHRDLFKENKVTLNKQRLEQYQKGGGAIPTD
ncbi:MAG: rod-binding protein [Candidatus Margulisiibacteriota bacterium]